MDAYSDIVARTIFGECRGEPELGQRAVAHVIHNRVLRGQWGASPLSVCLWPFQFSAWNPSDPNRKVIASIDTDDPKLTLLANYYHAALAGEVDPTKGALYYKVSSLPFPKDWGVPVDPLVTIGSHSFYILKSA